MRTKIVAGNWKMHGSVKETQSLLSSLNELLPSVSPQQKLVVCPTFVHLDCAAKVISSNFYLGAQDISAEIKGAFTGQISATMLKDFGATYCIVGHSERRAQCAESNELVAAKAAQALAHGITPIICVGESEEQYNRGETNAHISTQLAPVLALSKDKLRQVVLAYEPIWAIGTGKTATPQIAQSVHQHIRSQLREVDPDLADVSVLYGGSVKAENAASLIAQADIDGFLVGGASLDAQQFAQIYQNALS